MKLRQCQETKVTYFITVLLVSRCLSERRWASARTRSGLFRCYALRSVTGYKAQSLLLLLFSLL